MYSSYCLLKASLRVRNLYSVIKIYIELNNHFVTQNLRIEGKSRAVTTMGRFVTTPQKKNFIFVVKMRSNLR